MELAGINHTPVCERIPMVCFFAYCFIKYNLRKKSRTVLVTYFSTPDVLYLKSLQSC